MSPSDKREAGVLPLAECRLDLARQRDQHERYRALARDIAAIDRRPGGLEVSFEPDLDSGLLDQTLSVERECCPFLELHFDPGSRRLSIAVERPDQEPALEAIAYALAAEGPAAS